MKGSGTATSPWWKNVCRTLLGIGFATLLLPVGSLAAQTAQTKVTYYYTDPQGTVLATADEAGNVTATSDYRPYGVLALGTPEAAPGYTGHVNDSDSGLVYMQARYYDPEMGHFLSVDPSAVKAASISSINRYSYASNNPISNIDPDGRQTLPGSVYQLNWQDPVTRQVADQYALGMVPGYGAYQCASQGGCGVGGWTLGVIGALPFLAPVREGPR